MQFILHFAHLFVSLPPEIDKTIKSMANDKNTSKPQEKKAKKVNKTWEAFGKWKGAFTIIDPKFLL